MSGSGQAREGDAAHADGAYRRRLFAVLVINAAMFVVEGGAGLVAGSVSLQADALDFLGDAVAYAISLYVLGKSLRWRASAGLMKGATMGVFGVWVVVNTIDGALVQGMPSAVTMGAVGFLALGANVASALLLFRYRKGDSNVRSAWLCSRNDALGNLAVLVAASAVFATGTPWPDLVVGFVMASLELTAAAQVIRQAVGELKAAPIADAP